MPALTLDRQSRLVGMACGGFPSMAPPANWSPSSVGRHLLLLVFAVSLGCAGSHGGGAASETAADDFEGRCALSAKPSVRPPGDAFRGTSGGVVPPSTLSRTSRTIAEILGVLSVVGTIAELERRAPDNPESFLGLVAARQYLWIQIGWALSEVQSAAAEARCEKERADQLADRLQASLNREVRALTLSAILAGAVFGFASGGLFLAGASTAGTAVSLSGGVVETVLAGFGLAQDRTQMLRHSRNILREVWQGRASDAALPEIVWRFLNQPLEEEELHRSLRETMVRRWRDDGRLGEPGSDQERLRLALFFGDGGPYHIGDLRARAAMLSLLEADIHLMTQDLNLFLQEQLAHHPPSLPGS
ncbi:MAG TPA: hypothetical protein VFS39_10390 [Nitrospira sp.]|nr:hypothetical protein [Nitrospira sp.]